MYFIALFLFGDTAYQKSKIRNMVCWTEVQLQQRWLYRLSFWHIITLKNNQSLCPSPNSTPSSDKNRLLATLFWTICQVTASDAASRSNTLHIITIRQHRYTGLQYGSLLILYAILPRDLATGNSLAASNRLLSGGLGLGNLLSRRHCPTESRDISYNVSVFSHATLPQVTYLHRLTSYLPDSLELGNLLSWWQFPLKYWPL